MMVAWGTVAAGALAPFQAISSQGTPQDGRLQQKLHVCYLFPSISVIGHTQQRRCALYIPALRAFDSHAGVRHAADALEPGALPLALGALALAAGHAARRSQSFLAALTAFLGERARAAHVTTTVC